MAKPPASDDRCVHNAGSRWRCPLPRLHRSRYCQQHRSANQRSKSRARARVCKPRIEDQKKPGRPPKMKDMADIYGARVRVPADSIVKRKTARDRVSDPKAEMKTEEKKKPGPKPKEKSAIGGVGVPDPSTEKKKKKMRGGPALPQTKEGIDRGMVSDPSAEKKKKRGRPPNAKSSASIVKKGTSFEEEASSCKVSDPSVAKKKRGRPATAMNKKKGGPSIENTKKRRVGKPPKNSKPDEIELRGKGHGSVTVLESGQVWAFRDESDGFPRSYARIDCIDETGSSVHVSPLVPKLVLEEEKFSAEQGLPLVCGLFMASKSTLIKSLSALAHNVMFEKEGKESSLYRVFPKKGEIWAVYVKWDDLTKSFQYKLVESASDFNEVDGVMVFSLVHVEGKDGVYKRQVLEGFHLIRSYSRSFMPMFSHHVPASSSVEGGEILWKVMLH